MVPISKSELEAFLSELADFTKRYQIALTELDSTSSKLEGVREDVRQRISKSGDALSQIRQAIERLCERTEEFLEEINTERTSQR